MFHPDYLALGGSIERNEQRSLYSSQYYENGVPQPPRSMVPHLDFGGSVGRTQDGYSNGPVYPNGSGVLDQYVNVTTNHNIRGLGNTRSKYKTSYMAYAATSSVGESVSEGRDLVRNTLTNQGVYSIEDLRHRNVVGNIDYRSITVQNSSPEKSVGVVIVHENVVMDDASNTTYSGTGVAYGNDDDIVPSEGVFVIGTNETIAIDLLQENVFYIRCVDLDTMKYVSDATRLLKDANDYVLRDASPSTTVPRGVVSRTGYDEITTSSDMYSQVWWVQMYKTTR